MPAPFRRQKIAPVDETAIVIEPEAAEPTPPVASSDMLYDGPLLAAWFIQYALERELQRARRHERPLSIVVLTPVPSLGEEPTAEALAACASAAAATSRVTDLLGWLPGNRILVILPETDKDGAAAAIYRLSTEMATRSARMGQLRWIATARVDAFKYESAAGLIEDVGVHLVR